MNASPQGGSVDSGHSPAPWTVRFSDVAGYDAMSGGYYVRDAHDHVVVVVDVADALYPGNPLGINVPWETRIREHPLSAANARLIGAAPELLNALREVLDGIVAFDGEAGALDKARAAIAKATDERSEEAS